MTENGKPPVESMTTVVQNMVTEQSGAFGLNAAEMDLVQNVLYDRMRWWQDRMDPRKDIDRECGYPKWVSAEMYKDYFDRRSTARKVVEFMPKQAFKKPPDIYDDENENTVSEWEKWLRTDLESVFHQSQNYHDDGTDNQGSLFHEFLMRATIASRIGRYGIILVGMDDGLPLSSPAEGWKEQGSVRTEYYDKRGEKLPKPVLRGRLLDNKNRPRPYTLNYALPNVRSKRKITFIQCYPEAQARISATETNPQSPRYGRPIHYQIKADRKDLEAESLSGNMVEMTQVHWTRVLHIPASGLSSDIYGSPEMEPVLSHLIALEKNYGASDEGYWKKAFDTTILATDPKFGTKVQVNEEKVKATLFAIEQGMQRHGVFRGMTPTSLSGNVIDPTPFKDSHIEAICICKDWPVPVFKGYEIGEQASTNNSEQFHDNVRSFQHMVCTAKVIAPLLNLFIKYGLCPKPKNNKYAIKWPDLKVRSELEKATLASTEMTAVASWIQSGAIDEIPRMEFWTEIMGRDSETAKRLVDAAEKYQRENPPALPEEQDASLEEEEGVEADVA